MIFFFSATGNNQYIAKKISEITKENVENIGLIIKKECEFTLTNEDNITIVSPVYFYGPPLIVEDFIKKIDPKTVKNVNVVLSYGTFPGQAMARTEKILSASGLNINGKMTIRMPENYLLLFNPPGSKDCENIISKAEEKIRLFAEGMIHDRPVDLCDRPKIIHKTIGMLARPMYEHGRGTNRFHVNTNCIKCGKCVQMCPCDAIRMIDRIPTWIEKKCLRCCACINRCPHKAIEFGLLTKNKRRYVNPYVELEEQSADN